jgi:putative hemolysin
MEISLLIFLLITLLIISGFCSASETAFFSLSATKIKTYESSNNPRHQLVAELLRHPRDLLVTVFMVNTFVNIMVQSTASSLFGTAASWTLKVGVPFLLLLILGEIIPKYLGIQNSVRLSNLLAPLTMFIQNLLAPIRKAVIAVTAPISQVLFFFLRKEKSISRAELQHVLQQSEEHQVLRPDETELVWGYLNLQDTSIKELMRPREDILAYNLKDPLSKLTYLFIDLQCTRIPVYEDTIEQIVGVITAKRFFLNRESIRCPQDLHPFLKKPFFVPENTSARILLRRFAEKNEVMAIVVDEYGSISGL